ncbi:MAG: phosphoenolpyruvate carboxykinase (ATP) [Planctomycetota bacterium]
MATYGYSPSRIGLDRHGITDPGDVYWNLSAGELYEHAIRSGEGIVASNGAMVCTTGKHTGRSPKDKYIVEEPTTRDGIWWGQVNRAMSLSQFDGLHRRIVDHFRGRRLYVRDMFAGAEESSRMPIRVVTETAWHNLFAKQLFIRPEPGSTGDHHPHFTILNAPTCLADPAKDGTNSGVFIVIHFAKRLVLIGGTAYAGEIKKSVFTIMNYTLPMTGVFSMHCSANVGTRGDTALFFGLSGTGKTTLSADPDRRLIGDDEHGWSDHGVFNIEGGCYAKCIGLSRDHEPQIYQAIRFGAVVENVVVDRATRHVDYASDELTENTRVAYPLEYIHNVVMPSIGDHPKNIIFLTCDAFGVLPPISQLTHDQAMQHFLLGYTAKIAGTEAGVKEPKATFSTCFGSPFLPLPPERYAALLGERLAMHHTRCWLVNTGWTGGGVGVGNRVNLRYTRAMVHSALTGRLDGVAYTVDPVFGLSHPLSCPDVPREVLTPRRTWRDPEAFDAKAKELARLFEENLKTFSSWTARLAAAASKT